MLRVLVLTTIAVLAGLPAAADAAWIWPLRGPVLEGFRLGRDPFAAGQHRGIDIAAPAGTPVVSACAGVVRFAGFAGPSGRTASVVCGPLTATYLHLAGLAVRRGERVPAGARVGRVGRSGRPGHGASHLHLGARRTGRRWAYVDPLSLLGRPPAAAPAPIPLPGAAPRIPPAGEPLGRAPLPEPVRPRPEARRRPAARGAPEPVPDGPPLLAWAGAALAALAAPGAWWRRAQRRRGAERTGLEARRAAGAG